MMTEGDKRKIEITKDLDSYLSSRKRKPIADKIKRLVKKRGKKPVIQEVPLERVQAVIKERPVKKEAKETVSVFIAEKPILGSYFEWFKNLFSKKPDAEELELIEKEAEEVDIYQEKSFEEEEFEKEEELEEPPERKFSWNFFSNLFKRKESYKFPEESDISEETNIKKLVIERPEVEKDMKQMAIVTQEILKRLPEKELQDFKNSMEFTIYKDVLKRHKLIKEEKK